MRKLTDRKTLRSIDWWLVANIFALVLYGLVSIAAAMATAATGEEATLADKLANLNLYYVFRQAIWFVIGLVAMIFIMSIDYNTIKDMSPLIYWINIGILAALFVLGKATNNAVSWYTFSGIGFQPSELCKLSMLLMLSRVLSQGFAEDGIQTFRDLIKPAVIVVLPFVLIALQPDMGTAMVIACMALGVFFVVRIRKRIVLGCAGGFIAALPLIWLVLSTTQRNRIRVFLGLTDDATGTEYNVRMSQMAIGSGGVAGKGMFAEGNLSQLDWVPVKESDFIFSVAGETFGFIGGIILILLYASLLWRTIRIAIKTRDRFGSLVVIGIASMMFAHIFENMGMAMGIMPVTGIPLPFVSYGGSSMLTNMMAYGLVLNIGSRW